MDDETEESLVRLAEEIDPDRRRWTRPEAVEDWEAEQRRA